MENQTKKIHKIRRIFRKVKSKSNSDEEYEVCLTFYDGLFIPEKSGCTCPWGSFYGHSKKNEGKLCRHIKKILKEHARNKL